MKLVTWTSDQAVQISRLSSGKSFVGKRKKFVFNAFIAFKPIQRFENRGDVTEFGSLNHSSSKRVLNYLKTYLRFWKVVVQRVTIIKFRVNNLCGNGTGSFEVKIGSDTANFTNMVITRLRERER